MLVIVDAGLGNLKSIWNMLSYLGYDSIISSNPTDIEKADKIILPGVGSFDAGIEGLRERNLWDVLNYKVICLKTPCMGICLGMQLFMDSSEEGEQEGLGWIKGNVNSFKIDSNHRIPHIGWNYVSINKQHDVLRGFSGGERFYFVHSYYVCPDDNDNILLLTEYGIDFSSAILKNNILGVQFHPEKSHKFGMHLMRNFMEYM